MEEKSSLKKGERSKKQEVKNKEKITSFFPVLGSNGNGQPKMAASKPGDPKQKEALKVKLKDSRTLRSKNMDKLSDKSKSDVSTSSQSKEKIRNISVSAALKTPLSQVLRRSFEASESKNESSNQSKSSETHGKNSQSDSEVSKDSESKLKKLETEGGRSLRQKGDMHDKFSMVRPYRKKSDTNEKPKTSIENSSTPGERARGRPAKHLSSVQASASSSESKTETVGHGRGRPPKHLTSVNAPSAGSEESKPEITTHARGRPPRHLTSAPTPGVNSEESKSEIVASGRGRSSKTSVQSSQVISDEIKSEPVSSGRGRAPKASLQLGSSGSNEIKSERTSPGRGRPPKISLHSANVSSDEVKSESISPGRGRPPKVSLNLSTVSSDEVKTENGTLGRGRGSKVSLQPSISGSDENKLDNSFGRGKKMKRRHFRGGTYGLYLTPSKKKRKKLKSADESKDDDSVASTENNSFLDSEDGNSMVSEDFFQSEKSYMDEDHAVDSRSSVSMNPEQKDDKDSSTPLESVKKNKNFGEGFPKDEVNLDITAEDEEITQNVSDILQQLEEMQWDSDQKSGIEDSDMISEAMKATNFNISSDSFANSLHFSFKDTSLKPDEMATANIPEKSEESLLADAISQYGENEKAECTSANVSNVSMSENLCEMFAVDSETVVPIVSDSVTITTTEVYDNKENFTAASNDCENKENFNIKVSNTYENKENSNVAVSDFPENKGSSDYVPAGLFENKENSNLDTVVFFESKNDTNLKTAALFEDNNSSNSESCFKNKDNSDVAATNLYKSKDDSNLPATDLLESKETSNLESDIKEHSNFVETDLFMQKENSTFVASDILVGKKNSNNNSATDMFEKKENSELVNINFSEDKEDSNPVGSDIIEKENSNLMSEDMFESKESSNFVSESFDKKESLDLMSGSIFESKENTNSESLNPFDNKENFKITSLDGFEKKVNFNKLPADVYEDKSNSNVPSESIAQKESVYETDSLQTTENSNINSSQIKNENISEEVDRLETNNRIANDDADVKIDEPYDDQSSEKDSLQINKMSEVNGGQENNLDSAMEGDNYDDKDKDSDPESTIANCVKSRQRIKRRFTDDIVDTDLGILSVAAMTTGPPPMKKSSNKQDIPQDIIENFQSVTHNEAKRGPITKIECIFNYKQTPIRNCTCEGDTYQANISNDEEGVFCQAVDSIDDKLVGCSNPVVTSRLVRPSVKIPFTIMCEMHLWRLKHHHSCPYCGLFCSQGTFIQCTNMKTKRSLHLFHVQCQSKDDSQLPFCLHCGSTTNMRKVQLEMHMASPPSFFLSQVSKKTLPDVSKARISFSNSFDYNKDDESSQCIKIEDTGKVLSTAGLPNGTDKEELEKLLKVLSEENIRYGNHTPDELYDMASSGNLLNIVYMLAKGFDPSYKYPNHENETALHAAAAAGHVTVTHLLIQAGCCNEALNDRMYTPLMLAVENGHKDVVHYLVKRGALSDFKGENGMSALHLAAKGGNLEILKILMSSRDIDINSQDDGGWTPIVWASEHDHFEVVKYLLKRGANPNIRDNEGNIGLHWSAFSGSVDISYLYLDFGCDINAINELGDTPLHIASRQDSFPCVTLFLSRGADVQITNKAGKLPAECVIDKNSDTYLSLSLNMILKKITGRYQHRAEKILHRDISRGKEQIAIQCVNAFDDEQPPLDFLYVTENCETMPIKIDRTITSLQSCHCDDDCSTSTCSCASISYQCWYDKEGLLLPEFNLIDPPMLFECNRACSCWSLNCHNRVLQNGITSRLQLIRTKGKGWGVRTLKDIPKGAFICEYVGELISDSAADKRADDSYLFDLDNRDGETYCLDARYYGNISRFINHLCEPNLVPVKVYVDHQDLNFPRIAFFSSRDIKQYEELGFDYGEKFWAIKYKTFTCECGTPKCKYSKETIHLTLANYYRRLKEEQLEEAAATQLPAPQPES